jgi:hypothetical protein
MYKLAVLFIFVLSLLVRVQKGQTQDFKREDIGIFVGLGLTNGNDYANDLKNAVGANVSGYLGWININAGLQFKIIEKLYFSPHFRWLAGRVSTTIKGFESSPNKKVNSIFLLGGSVNYYLREQLYAQLSLSRISTTSETNNLKYDPDGIETGIAIGYEFWMDSKIVGIELGYTLIPVKTGSIGDFWNTFGGVNSIKKRDYGGIFINIKATFQIGNYK